MAVARIYRGRHHGLVGRLEKRTAEYAQATPGSAKASAFADWHPVALMPDPVDAQGNHEGRASEP